MKTWKSVGITLAMAILSSGCGMSETKVIEAKPLEGVKTLAASEQTKKLDTEVLAFLREGYTIASARYYMVEGDIPWIAVSKSVQNQMAEKSFERKIFPWYEPGFDFVEVYPQANGKAFAVAMPKGTKSSAEKLVGYYVLTATAKR